MLVLIVKLVNTMSVIKELCKEVITPAIVQSGWDRSVQISFCEDSNFAYHYLNTEYVLFYAPNIPITVISVIEDNTNIDRGIENAIKNAENLDVPCAFCSNGNGFVFYNRTKLPQYAKTELNINKFPSPDHLWAIYIDYKSAKAITIEIEKATSRGLSRLLIGILGIATSLLSIICEIIKNLFASRKEKRVLYLTDRENDFVPEEWTLWQKENRQQNQILENNHLKQDMQSDDIVYTQIPDTDIKIYHASIREEERENDANKYRLFPSDYFDIIFLDTNSKNCIKRRKCQEILQHYATVPQIAIKPQEIISKSDIEYFKEPICIDLTISSLVEPIQIEKETIEHVHVNNIVNNQYTTNNTIISNSNSSPTDRPFDKDPNHLQITEYKTHNNILFVNNTNKYNKTTINFTTMARQTSFAHQIELAQELKTYLIRLQENLNNAAQKYIAKSASLDEAGMMEEKHQVLEEYMEETVNGIKNIVNQINEADIPFVEKYIEYLEDSDSVK